MTAAHKRQLWNDLQKALAASGREYPDGDWKGANERISEVRAAIDREWKLETLGIVGNNTIIKILRGFKP